MSGSLAEAAALTEVEAETDLSLPSVPIPHNHEDSGNDRHALGPGVSQPIRSHAMF